MNRLHGRRFTRGSPPCRLHPPTRSSLMRKAFEKTVRPFLAMLILAWPATVSELAALRILVEESAANGVAAFDVVIRFDLNWRTSVFRGEIEHVTRPPRNSFSKTSGRGVENAESFLSAIDSFQAQALDFPTVECGPAAGRRGPEHAHAR